jgi:hypothetical protein
MHTYIHRQKSFKMCILSGHQPAYWVVTLTRQGSAVGGCRVVIRFVSATRRPILSAEYTCMYVCMYVCMYESMFVCMSVFYYLCITHCMYEECTYVNVYIHTRVYVLFLCMNSISMYVYMYVCMYVRRRQLSPVVEVGRRGWWLLLRYGLQMVETRRLRNAAVVATYIHTLIWKKTVRCI